MIESNHLLSINSLSDAAIGGIFAEALLCLRGDYTPFLAGKVIQSVFLENSTRTRVSFEMAASRLGAMVVGLSEVGSSMAKGESVTDTLATLAAMRPDAMIVRLSQAGELERLAATSKFPIICAGEGGVHHPTQALLDLYTIYNECKKLDGLAVALIGALDQGRTARSLAYLLGKFDRTKLYFIAPNEMQIKPDILEHLDEQGVAYELADSTDNIIEKVDAVYQTRIDRNRLHKKDMDLSKYNIDANVLQRMRPNSVIMHPLPRSVEIHPQVDSDTRAAYFRQSRNGLYVRMALLTMVFDDY